MTKILLVEDDGQIASYLGELLRAEGFDTQIAGSKKEAGECLLAQAFDLVLLDVSLPDGNGFSICAEIKREYEIPVIFLTASGDEYSVVAGLDMGADSQCVFDVLFDSDCSYFTGEYCQYNHDSSAASHKRVCDDKSSRLQQAYIFKNDFCGESKLYASRICDRRADGRFGKL